ncbi:hypothetical protein LINPERPRIM_LOCUS16181 [Linum perenne]
MTRSLQFVLMILNTSTTLTLSSCLLIAYLRSVVSLKIIRRMRTRRLQLMSSCLLTKLQRPSSTPWISAQSTFCSRLSDKQKQHQESLCSCFLLH